MATVLQSSILIITTTPDSQPIYVTPNDNRIEGTIIILVYEPTGSGHYDAAIPYSDTATQSVKLTRRQRVRRSV